MKHVVVETKNGAVKGRELVHGYAWLGIPYATPPIGELRFKKSLSVSNWEGVHDATAFSKKAVQCQTRLEQTSEDCLYLNIWSPAADQTRRPVLFFIHGGSFAKGAGSDPEYNGELLSHNGDVVVVTINYRLGALGFLDFSCLGDGFDANCGLSDVLLALSWVHENIEAFGGNPANITVFGQSAGATITCVMATLREARPYLSKIIMMSGGPTLLRSKEENCTVATHFLEHIGVRSKEELQTLPPEAFLGGQQTFSSACGLGAGTFMIELDGSLVQQYPIPAAMQGAAKGIPALIGTTKEEMSFFFIRPIAKMLDIAGIMNSGVGMEKDEVKQRIMQSYERYGKRGKSIMLADMVFRMGSVWYAEAHNRHANTWMYRFDYETPSTKMLGLRAFHSSDIPFVFGNFKDGLGKVMFFLPGGKEEQNMLYHEMQQDFISFAKTGHLPWQPCKGESTLGKCYDKTSSIEHMVDPHIKKEYKNSNFYTRSFRGEHF